MFKQRSRRFDKFKLGWLQTAKQFFWMLIAVFLVFQLLIGVSFVKGESMEPTLSTGQVVVYNRLTRLTGHYQIGDVVSVRVPSDSYYVKRVIALGGDTVDIRDGVVYVNDIALDEPYIQGPTEPRGSLVSYPLTLKPEQVFVLGDNRPNSLDSREFGPVNVRQIRGRLVMFQK